MREIEHQVGFNAVQAAVRLCRSVQSEMLWGDAPAKLDKLDRSPVTVADFGAQAIVCHDLNTAFPEDAIVAEEDSQALRKPANAGQLSAVTRFVSQQAGSVTNTLVCQWIDQGTGVPTGRYWALDPIDGTQGFLRHEQYAIALALIEDGEVQWGCLGCPALPHAASRGLLFVAARGGGAHAYTLAGDLLGPIRVSDTHDIHLARMAESVESAHTNRGLSVQLKKALGMDPASVLMDSQAKYAAVARGQADVYLRSPNPKTPDYRENVWDHAAGDLIVHEAGGCVTDVYGRPLDWTQGRRLEKNVGVVATNGYLHDAILDALADCLSTEVPS